MSGGTWYLWDWNSTSSPRRSWLGRSDAVRGRGYASREEAAAHRHAISVACANERTYCPDLRIEDASNDAIAALEFDARRYDDDGRAAMAEQARASIAELQAARA